MEVTEGIHNSLSQSKQDSKSRQHPKGNWKNEVIPKQQQMHGTERSIEWYRVARDKGTRWESIDLVARQIGW